MLLCAVGLCVFCIAEGATGLVGSRKDDERGSMTLHSPSHIGNVQALRVPLYAPANRSWSANLQHHLLGHGFHRTLELDLSLATEYKSCGANNHLCCEVMVVQSLGRSIFADLDELQDLHRFGAAMPFSEVLHIDTEEPAQGMYCIRPPKTPNNILAQHPCPTMWGSFPSFILLLPPAKARCSST